MTSTEQESKQNPGNTLPKDLPWPLAVLLLVVVGWGLMLITQSSFGLWEPWETSWAEIARNMRNTGQWFYPTFDDSLATRPLLPLWAIAFGQGLGASPELAMRLPLSLGVLGGALALYTWLRNVFGSWRAFAASAAALSCPLVFLSGTTLAGFGLFQGALMASVSAFGVLVALPESQARAPHRLLLGLALALGVLSQGIWGLLLPLAIFATAGMVGHFGPEDKEAKPLALTFMGLSVVAALSCTIWAWYQGWTAASIDILGIAGPALLIFGALMASLGSHSTGRIIGGTSALLVLSPPLATLSLVVVMFQSQQPADTLETGVPVLRMLAGNLLVSPKALPAHVDFDFWVRQIGFSAYPWTALLPFGFAWLIRDDQKGAQRPRDAARHLLGAWFVASVLMMFLLGTVYEHYLFPGAAALGTIAALAASDVQWWSKLRQRPLQMRIIGFAAILTIMFLSKDLERYPKELLGPLLLDGSFEVPEEFSYGRMLKILRYSFVAVLFFFFMDIPSLVYKVWARVQSLNKPNNKDTSPDWLNKLMNFGGAPTFVASFGLVVLIFVSLTGFRWVPALSHHLSQKGLVEAYQEHATGDEPLMTYQLGSSSASFYLGEVQKLSTLAELKKVFAKEDQRAFMVLPRKQLSQLNYEIRKQRKAKDPKPRQNIHVIDDRSSRYVLASNMRKEDEAELSPIVNAILPKRPKPAFQVVVKDESDERQYVQFDKRVQLIGYDLFHENEIDRWGNPTPEADAALKALKKKGQLPVFKTGENMVIRYYFKVLKSITGSKQIFLHVDFPGSRINGDHYPMEEFFPTNHWLPGDYVVDTQRLEIEPGSAAGEYSLYMGFFQGSKRMSITPKLPVTRDNRVELGKVTIK